MTELLQMHGGLPLDGWSALAAVSAVTLGATLQSAIGFGSALVAAPLLALIDPRLVPGPLVATAFLVSLLVAVRDRRGLELRLVGWALVGRVPGIAAGLWALTALPARALQLLFATLVLGAVAMSFGGVAIRVRRRSLILAGALSGAMGTVAGIGGPPMALLQQHEAGERFRANLSTYFVVGTTMTLCGLAGVGRFGSLELWLSGLLAPGVLLGFLLSRAALGQLKDHGARTFVLWISATSALAVIARAWF